MGKKVNIWVAFLMPVVERTKELPSTSLLCSTRNLKLFSPFTFPWYKAVHFKFQWNCKNKAGHALIYVALIFNHNRIKIKATYSFEDPICYLNITFIIILYFNIVIFYFKLYFGYSPKTICETWNVCLQCWWISQRGFTSTIQVWHISKDTGPWMFKACGHRWGH